MSRLIRSGKNKKLPENPLMLKRSYLILWFLRAGMMVPVLPALGQPPLSSPLRPQLVEKERLVEASPPPSIAWQSAEVGRELVKREIVAARDRSRAVVRISGDRLLRVNANSQLMILPSLVEGTALGVELQKGEIYLHSRGRGAEMSIKTPVVEGRPHGTQFRVKVEDDGTTTFTMFEGTVDLVNGLGKLRLDSHEQGIVEPGKPPRRTAQIVAKNTIQWCLYYPGVLHLREIGLTLDDQRRLAAPIAAYGTGDLLGALASWPANYPVQEASARVFHAMVLLSVGQVEEARAELSGVPADASGRRAIEEMIDAVNFVERPASREPRSAGEWLARSYYEQSRSRLESALAAARQATIVAPDFGFAAVRVAELEFSFGHTKAAMKELTRGLQLSPRNAQAYSLQGFMFSDWNRITDARASFETAIGLDSALGTAWLGRGLCDIHRGREEAGRRDLQTATILEPNRSLFHSYLGKAASQLGLTKAALEDLEYAKRLDPRDPTPWLYSALVHQEQYKPNLAIGELEKSIALNDNRRLYRSALLLDQDRAVRGANLAKLYQYNGMTEVAVREATRAVESDYTNPSAHLFLANSFDALRDPRRVELRQETPWFNELLLANLLAPVGGGPLSQFVSQEEYSKLLEADGSGGSLISEWRSNSEQRSTASVFGTYGRVSYGVDASFFDDSGDRLNSDNSRTEIYGQFKWQVTPDDIFYFLGKWQDAESGDNFENYANRPVSPGFRFNETQTPGLLLGGWNHRWGPGSNTLFLGGRLGANQELTDPRSTQLLLKRSPAGLYPGFVHTDEFGYDVYTDPALQGALQPPASLAADDSTVIYSPALLSAIAPYIGSGQVAGVGSSLFDFATQRQFEIYTAELQHIQQNDWNTLLAGARWQGGRFDTDTRLSVLQPNFSGGFSTPAADQHSETDIERTSLYVYDYYSPVSWLTLIGGVAWDRLDHPDNFRNPPVNDKQREEQQVSGKLGFTMTPSRWFHLRGAYAEGLGGVTFDESVRLEPSQVAGFNQAYRTVLSESIAGSVEAPLFKTWGLGIDGVLPSRTWWGATFKVIQQDVDRTIGAFSGYDIPVFPSTPAYFPDGTSQQLAYRECALGATLNQLIGDEFSIGLTYQVTRSDLRNTYPELVGVSTNPSLKDRATLQELSLSGHWNSPTGFFATLEANAFAQDLEDDPNGFAPPAVPRDGDSFWQFNALVGYRFWRNQGAITLGVLNIGDTDYQLSPLTPYGEIVRGSTAVVACRLNF